MSPSLWQRLTGRGAPAKTIAAPTEEELAKDKEAVQKAIAEAVSTALTGDDFTKAVAGHLATQLQPSLKSALDLSSVETKLLESNAELSKRIDESNAETTSKLSSLSASNSTADGKISSIEAAVAHITESLAELQNTVKALQETVSSPDTSLLASHGEKLDTISTDLKTLQEQGPAPVALAFSSQATKLDAITAELAIIKESAETAATLKNITSELGSFKTDLEISANVGLSGLSTQIGNVLTAIDSQNTTLAEIKAADVGTEVLKEVKESNGFHSKHDAAFGSLNEQFGGLTASLADIKSSLPGAPEKVDLAPLVSTLDAHTAHLTEIKSAVITPAPTAEKVDLTPLVSTLDAHTAELAEIKSAVNTPAPTAEKIDLAPLVSTLDAHTAHLTEIKSAVNAPAPAAERVDISPLVSTLDAHTAELAEIKSAVNTPPPAPEKVDLAPLAATLDTHTAHLTEIKSAVNTPAPAAEKVDLSTLEGSVKEIVNTLGTQSTTLSEIKTASAGTGVLAAIENVKNDLGKEDAEIIAEVKSVKALIEGLPAPVTPEDKSSEILIEVKEVKALVQKSATFKVQEVGENDKGVEVPKKVEGNGVKVEEAEVAADV